MNFILFVMLFLVILVNFLSFLLPASILYLKALFWPVCLFFGFSILEDVLNRFPQKLSDEVNHCPPADIYCQKMRDTELNYRYDMIYSLILRAFIMIFLLYWLVY